MATPIVIPGGPSLLPAITLQFLGWADQHRPFELDRDWHEFEETFPEGTPRVPCSVPGCCETVRASFVAMQREHGYAALCGDHYFEAQDERMVCRTPPSGFYDPFAEVQ